ncbi:MAG TPA: hypothetical protein VE400_17900 [Mycobacterium sp.]|nr:hypothetical protein [Mycobacterium sp.]
MKRALETGFQDLSTTVPATISLAIVSAGANSVASLGTWSTGVAWSTIKVPLAIAALRAGSGNRELVAATITQSDNAAAEQLWCELGNPDEAAAQVQAVIRDGGDTTTVVESRRLRPDYSAFGQTQWSLVRQARFAAALPSIPDASPVVDLMGNLAPDHRWGLAAKGFAAKAGWGPGMNDGYLVRQFAILPAESGTTGLALAADAHDGVFETGVDVLNTLSDWVIENLAELTHD